MQVMDKRNLNVTLEEILHNISAEGRSILEKRYRLEEEDLQTYGDSLTKEIKSLLKSSNNLLEDLKKPIKIGIMGEFSSGKTTLIGSLIGNVGSLPYSPEPSTGNITSILIQQVEKEDQTKLKSNIEYQSPEDSIEFFRFAYSTISKEDEKISDELKEVIMAETDQIDWKHLEVLCENIALKDITGDISSIIKELWLYAAAINKFGEMLHGKILPKKLSTLREGLSLKNYNEIEAIDSIKKSTLIDLPDKNSEQEWIEFIKLSFPLIKRVNIVAYVPRAIWDVSEFKGQLLIVDTPGLGSDKSGIRDSYLTGKAIEDVQTILIVTNCNSPGGDKAKEVYRLLREKHGDEKLKEYCLLAAGRFDALEVTDEEIVDIAEREELSENDILNELGPLNAVISSARKYVYKTERIVLFSAYNALKDYKNSPNVRIHSGLEKKINNFISMEMSDKILQGWRKLTEVETLQNSSLISRYLTDYVNDGGLQRLKETLTSHVSEHGYQTRINQLDSSIESIISIKNRIELLEKKSHTLNKLASQQENNKAEIVLGYLQALNTHYRTLLIDSIDDSELELTFQYKAKKVALREYVLKQCVDKVNDWDMWEKLFGKMKDGVVLQESSSLTKGPALLDIPDNDPLKLLERTTPNEADKELTPDRFPHRSSDLHQYFDKTLSDLENDLIKSISNAVNEYLARISDNGISKDPDDSKSIKSGLIELAPDVAKIEDYKRIELLIEPRKWYTRVNSMVVNSVKNKWEKETSTQKIIPLPTREEPFRNSPDFHCPWSPLSPMKYHKNHGFFILQLKVSCVKSIKRICESIMDKTDKDIKQNIKHVVSTLITPQLQELSNISTLKKAFNEDSTVEDDKLSLIADTNSLKKMIDKLQVYM